MNTGKILSVVTFVICLVLVFPLSNFVFRRPAKQELRATKESHEKSYSKGLKRDFLGSITTDDIKNIIQDKCHFTERNNFDCGRDLLISFKDEAFIYPSSGEPEYSGKTRTYEVFIVKGWEAVSVATEACKYPLNESCQIGPVIEKIIKDSTLKNELTRFEQENKIVKDYIDAFYGSKRAPASTGK